jgi:hypothetical protein
MSPTRRPSPIDIQNLNTSEQERGTLVLPLDLVFSLDLVLSIDLVLRLGPALSLGSGLALARVISLQLLRSVQLRLAMLASGVSRGQAQQNDLSAGQPLIMA